ncbi:MAG: hypothetical protein K0Q77_46 [Anaerosporomusa subterranea]|jgi:hypothetical protein|nr:hypothetical protein [Anaerosporomusa subterranea]MDF2572311.1 hypothetical protein [Sporomusa sp.]
MAMTVNGVSTTKDLGQEQYEKFRNSANKKTYVAYDYRHTNGNLFSCVRPALEACRAERDKWITKQ